jgi:hypothetical protein
LSVEEFLILREFCWNQLRFAETSDLRTTAIIFFGNIILGLGTGDKGRGTRGTRRTRESGRVGEWESHPLTPVSPSPLSFPGSQSPIPNPRSLIPDPLYPVANIASKYGNAK